LNNLLSLQMNGSETAREVPASEGIAVLTAAIVHGDEQAFEAFHERYFDRLYQFLLVVTRGNELQAREALQETLLRVARHPHVFCEEEGFWRWLKVVARNSARDEGRKRFRYFALLERFALDRNRNGDGHPAADENSLRSLLVESMEELPAEDRYLIEAKYLQGAAVKIIAPEMGLSGKAVESRLVRLRRQLRECLLNKLKQA
jgi:RNA polymerase sigma-70 factor (ECF subfamily)